MLQFKQSVFAGFVTDVGGKTSHTAIVARSMDIPAVVGARSASHLISQDDWVIIDGDAGVVVVDPSPILLAEYGFKQRQGEVERERLSRLRKHPGRHARRPEDRAAGQHRTTRRRGWRAQGRRRGGGAVPHRIPLHGPKRQAARRGRASTRPTSARWRACRACRSPSARWTWGPTNRWTARPRAPVKTISTPRWGCAPFAGAWPIRPCSWHSCAPSCGPPRMAPSTC